MYVCADCTACLPLWWASLLPPARAIGHGPDTPGYMCTSAVVFMFVPIAQHVCLCGGHCSDLMVCEVALHDVSMLALLMVAVLGVV